MARTQAVVTQSCRCDAGKSGKRRKQEVIREMTMKRIGRNFCRNNNLTGTVGDANEI